MSQAPFTLYTTARSANGRKPLLLCRHLGLQPEVVEVDVYRGEGRSPEYLEINRLGKIPTLVDGDLVLTESNAQLVYIAEAYGDGALWSRDVATRADISRWLFWEASAWQPAFLPVLAGFVGHLLLGGDPSAAPEVDWSDDGFLAAVGHLDVHLRDRDFLVGEGLTVADLAVAGMTMYLPAARFPFDDFPGIGAWYDRVNGLEAWRATAVEPWLE